jgi:hypothetical protein
MQWMNGCQPPGATAQITHLQSPEGDQQPNAVCKHTHLHEEQQEAAGSHQLMV